MFLAESPVLSIFNSTSSLPDRVRDVGSRWPDQLQMLLSASEYSEEIYLYLRQLEVRGSGSYIVFSSYAYKKDNVNFIFYVCITIVNSQQAKLKFCAIRRCYCLFFPMDLLNHGGVI